MKQKLRSLSSSLTLNSLHQRVLSPLSHETSLGTQVGKHGTWCREVTGIFWVPPWCSELISTLSSKFHISHTYHADYTGFYQIFATEGRRGEREEKIHPCPHESTDSIMNPPEGKYGNHLMLSDHWDIAECGIDRVYGLKSPLQGRKKTASLEKSLLVTTISQPLPIQNSNISLRGAYTSSHTVTTGIRIKW